MSIATWYICPIGSDTLVKFCPWLVVIPMLLSPVAIQWSGFFGSIQMSWQSPQPPPEIGKVSPPSVERWKLLLAISTSSGLAGIDGDADVVAGPPDQGAVPAHDAP